MVTLVFQRPEEVGLEVSPGRETVADPRVGDQDLSGAWAGIPSNLNNWVRFLLEACSMVLPVLLGCSRLLLCAIIGGAAVSRHPSCGASLLLTRDLVHISVVRGSSAKTPAALASPA